LASSVLIDLLLMRVQRWRS